jgi:antitoxin component YwqK of YwqJK toxin-antitoxin module
MFLTEKSLKTLLGAILLIIGVLPMVNAQSLDQLLKTSLNTSRLVLADGDSIEEISLLPLGNDTRVNENYYYLWYDNNQVKVTKGGYGGRLLDGQYILYNRNKDLIQKGQIDKGLRTGVWLSWYVNGNIKYKENWKKGIREGRFEEYYEDGVLKRRGRFKGGELSGKLLNYTPAGETTTLKYKNGKLKLQNEVKDVKTATNDPVKRRKLIEKAFIWRKKEKGVTDSPIEQKQNKKNSIFKKLRNWNNEE